MEVRILFVKPRGNQALPSLGKTPTVTVAIVVGRRAGECDRPDRRNERRRGGKNSHKGGGEVRD